MEEKKIKEVLFGSVYLIKPFQRMQVKELCEIMDFCKSTFRTSKGNWSVRNALKFCEADEIELFGLYQNLAKFYIEYRKRKKEYLGFRNFLFQLGHHFDTRGIFKPDKSKPELIEKSKLKHFLLEMKEIKHRYLDATDDMFLKFISKGVHTGFKESTLKKYYYEKKDSKKSI